MVIKNVFQWIAGQLGASLQEFVTRDLRDGVFRHMQRLPLGYFHRTKVGQIIAKILTDTEQTKNIITELATRSVQNVAKVVATIAALTIGVAVLGGRRAEVRIESADLLELPAVHGQIVRREEWKKRMAGAARIPVEVIVQSVDK